MTTGSMRDRILDAAERRAREAGYHGFSFRDVAADVGIKSASVHYHFPTKGSLAQALAQRYKERALETIGEPQTPLDAFDRVAALFRQSILVENRMCLCGVFAAEKDGLPTEVAGATQQFFQALIMALERPSEHRTAPYRAETVLAALEGAVLLGKTLGDVGVFERITSDLRRAYPVDPAVDATA